MNNDEFEKLRREINESVLTEDLNQHHELYADDINVPIEEAWSEPAMGRDVGMAYKGDDMGMAHGRDMAYGRDHDHMGMAHGRDMAYGRDHDHMGMAYKADDGSEFPDLNKDGEITQADILMGKGVIDKPASARDDMGDAHGRDMAYGRDMGDAHGRDMGMAYKHDMGDAHGRDMGMAYKHDEMGMAHGRDMGMAYKGDTMTWEQMTGGEGREGREAHNRVDEANLWESKSATVRGWIIENFKPLRSDGYDPERIVSVSERKKGRRSKPYHATVVS